MADNDVGAGTSQLGRDSRCACLSRKAPGCAIRRGGPDLKDDSERYLDNSKRRWDEE